MLAAGLARLGQPRNALRHAELALARGLLDDLAGSDPVERERIRGLTKELYNLGERLTPLLVLSDPSPEQVAQREHLVHRRRKLEAEQSRLASAISARQILALVRLQQKLPGDTALVFWIDELDEHLGCVLRRETACQAVTPSTQSRPRSWRWRSPGLPPPRGSSQRRTPRGAALASRRRRASRPKAP